MTEPSTVTPPSSINDSPGTGKMSETPVRGGWLAFAAVLWLIAVLTIAAELPRAHERRRRARQRPPPPCCS